MAHVHAFAFFDGEPKLLVPDNLRSAVTKASSHAPVLNENYARMARHYGTAIMPARPYKPKDKSKVENAVLIVERWILMRLRHEHFYTLSNLNQRIQELLFELNHRKQRVHPGSRWAGLSCALCQTCLLGTPSSCWKKRHIRSNGANYLYLLPGQRRCTASKKTSSQRFYDGQRAYARSAYRTALECRPVAGLG